MTYFYQLLMISGKENSSFMSYFCEQSWQSPNYLDMEIKKEIDEQEIISETITLLIEIKKIDRAKRIYYH